METQVLDLKAGLILILSWFLSSFFPILGLISTLIYVSGQSGTTRVAIERKAEEARESEQQVVETERESIENLDSRLHRVLEARSTLQTAMGSDTSTLSQELDKELDKTAQQIVGEMHKHYRSCDKAEAIVKAIEIEQRVTKEMTNPEFFKHAEKRMKEEKKKNREDPKRETMVLLKIISVETGLRVGFPGVLLAVVVAD
jgi:valyl-tRNA synthetase